jgi:hypothetical protein
VKASNLGELTSAIERFVELMIGRVGAIGHVSLPLDRVVRVQFNHERVGCDGLRGVDLNLVVALRMQQQGIERAKQPAPAADPPGVSSLRSDSRCTDRTSATNSVVQCTPS